MAAGLSQKHYHRTSDPEKARRWLSARYQRDARLTVLTPEQFNVAIAGRSWPEFGFSFVTWTGTVQVSDVAATDYVTVHEILDGEYRYQQADTDLFVSPTGFLLVSSGSDLTATLANVQNRSLTISTALLRELAAAAGASDVQFTGHCPISIAAARNLRRVFNFTETWGRDDDAADNPLSVHTTSRLLAATLLHSFPNTAVSAELAPPDSHELSAVDRAVTYVRENLAKNIGVPDIAKAARVSDRSLHDMFQRRFDEPPMAYVRGLRLDAAHRELRVMDPSSGTIKSVAARWGFPSAGHFTAAYKKRFNMTPSQSLNTKTTDAAAER